LAHIEQFVFVKKPVMVHFLLVNPVFVWLSSVSLYQLLLIYSLQSSVSSISFACCILFVCTVQLLLLLLFLNLETKSYSDHERQSCWLVIR